MEEENLKKRKLDSHYIISHKTEITSSVRIKDIRVYSFNYQVLELVLVEESNDFRGRCWCARGGSFFFALAESGPVQSSGVLLGFTSRSYANES